MALEIFNIVKRINGGMFAIKGENLLFGFRSPKIVITIVNPASDKSGRYESERAFLDVPEVYKLIHGLQFRNPQNPEAPILKSFKGNFDKKLQMVVSRVFSVQPKGEYTNMSIELVEGEQSTAKNKAGETVPGIVRPKRGGQAIRRGSFGLSKDEVRYVAKALENELAAWRVAMNIDFMNNPQKYDFRNNQRGNASQPPVPQDVPPVPQDIPPMPPEY